MDAVVETGSTDMPNMSAVMKKWISLRSVADELQRLDSAREKAISQAFHTLENQDPALAHLVLQNIGDRQRAARWMCMHQRAFGGRSAYELLAEGDVDTVWDRVCGEDAASPVSAPAGGLPY
jgi:hypothetical protein